MDMSVDPVICRAKRRTLELESIAENISQCIVEEDNVINLLAAHAKRHIDKAMDNWQATKALTKTVAELSGSL